MNEVKEALLRAYLLYAIEARFAMLVENWEETERNGGLPLGAGTTGPENNPYPTMSEAAQGVASEELPELAAEMAELIQRMGYCLF